ncbi:MAG: 3'(2'),5'-bisphosphate nucleotidase CysQ [Bacteroidetes bacterium ADurb.Bin397]|nr:MAG: 3'(2'),5'-bisphosphate nucleotidase CysQ [Bacteroidetes bacterium ADurb.Bin397]
MNKGTLLHQAILASIEAGLAIMNVYDGPHEIEIKDDKSPLTIADRQSHLSIMAHLKETGIPVLSEEGKNIPYEERKDWPLFWMVDPLDGTKEFIKRNGEFTVNIALIENGAAVAGVIYAPVPDTLWYGSTGSGSFKVDQAAKVLSNFKDVDTISYALNNSAVSLPKTGDARPFTVVASRSHLSPETETLIAELKEKHKIIEFVSKGSSLKICLVAEGSADIYPRLAPTMEWDTAAGQAVVEAAGGRVLRAADRQPLAYNKEDLLNPSFIACRVGWRFAWAGAEF